MLRWLLVILVISQVVFALPLRANVAAQRAQSATADPLPAAYFRLLEAGAAKVEQRMNSIPDADLKALEAHPNGVIFPTRSWLRRCYTPNSIRAMRASVIAKCWRSPFASEICWRARTKRESLSRALTATGTPTCGSKPIGCSNANLGEERRARWAKAIKENIALLVSDARERLDFPWYHSPFIGTSPNHYAQWATLLLLGGIVFGDRDWEQLGKQMLLRFATVDQSPDGFWGEHNREGPTTGYDYLTLTGVGLYYEYSKDPAVASSAATFNGLSQVLHVSRRHSGGCDQ